MVVTDKGKEHAACLLGGSIASIPTYMAIGSGSGTEAVTVTDLFAEYTDKRVTFTGSPDCATVKKITWTGDWDSVSMSGLSLHEFALMVAATGGEPWGYTNLGNPVIFSGTKELKIELEWEVF